MSDASDYDSFGDFARAIHDALPDEWDTRFDDICLEKTEGEQSGYQRDDLYKWMMVQPNDGNWEEEVIFYIPDGIDEIPDRPGIPTRSLENPSVESVLSFLEENTPDYQGTFTYDDE